MIVIADDITGAAEIAGMAFQRGWQTSLVCGGAMATTPLAGDVTVIATDTRSMTLSEAVAESRRIASHLSPLNSRLFKKTDSALRGHVVAELQALLQTTGLRRAVYVPANPSKGRTVRGGVYYIGDRPIHETDFSFDPEFPARTSVLRERFPDAAASHILMPDAVTAADLADIVARYDDGHTLFAGAADLFTALGPTPGPSPREGETASTPVGRGQGWARQSSTLILCGSTQSRPLDLGIPVAEMPLAVYEGHQTAADWLQQISPSPIAPHPSLILTIPHRHRTGKAIAVHLRTVMAELTRELVARHRPDHLIIEGGATAWATLQALGWTQFTIERQVAPGVVQMRAQCGTLVTLKPGSYPWGNLF